MVDFRKKLLINITGSHLGFVIEETTWDKDVIDMPMLEQFLESENQMLLCACLELHDNNKRIKYYDNVTNTPANSRTVVFSKHHKTLLRDDNLLQSIDIASLQGSPASALYHTLNNVFTPLINKNHKNNANIDKHLANLQAGLRASLLTELDDVGEGDQLDSLAMILSIDQEVEYWHNLTTTAKTKPTDKTMAASFRDMLIPVARDLAVLEALPISDVEDMEENCHNALDDLWRHDPPYPKARMEHLMDIISNDIVSYISKQFTRINIWKEDYNKATELLDQCLGIGKHWLSSCRELTEIFWPNYSLHFWRGPAFVPESLANLVERLLQIHEIRATHRQLTRLLTREEHEDLQCGEMFRPFEHFDALQGGVYAEQNWSSATKQFEYLLKPAEQTVANKLKEQFSTVNANTRQLLYEFGRYTELICRPVLRNILQTERKYLLSLLKDYVRTLSGQMTQTPMLSVKYETPQVVSDILGTRQLEAKAAQVLTISKKILNDLDNYQDLEQATSELLKELKDQHTDLYESWTTEILEQIKTKKLSLCEADPVVQFTPNKLMRVNYSPRLVTLISEVRQLTTLGYNIPETIVQTSGHAKQFMNYAKYLEQIAHFHNTFGDLMIPSQRPMMLPSAIELSKLVQEQQVVSWGDIKSVESYVDNLKNAVDKLSKENNVLTSFHLEVVDLIEKLKGVDLIKHYEKWKFTAKQLRDIMHQVQQKGFLVNAMMQWKHDVDTRLAKVLEEQYAKSLDTVHLYLPEINCDLIYREAKLKFSPEEEILRKKYEQQMKESLDIPKKFRGVSDQQTTIFAQIIEKCHSQLAKVEANTEKLFEQLQGVKKHWEAWLTLDKLDVSKLSTWQDWELHFRASKTFGQEIAKLPSEEEKIGCFKIGLSWLRSDLESHNRSYWEQLVNTLKDSIAQDVLKLQDYVDTSTGTLNRQPLTLEQIGEADASHADILNHKPEMEALHKDLMQKVHILSSWNRERIDAVNRMLGGWERLQNLMENYQHIIAKQVETIKTTLTIASENLNNEIERFGAKWEQVKPRPNSGQISTESMEELNKHYQNINEKKEQWKELIERQQTLLHDFGKFSLEAPTFELSDAIEKDLNKEEHEWSLFNEFYQGLERLSNEEWIVFRKKYYKLQDFLNDWESRLDKVVEKSALVTRILQEIHKYQAAAPILKSLKGDDFTDKHWMEVYEVLNMMPKSLDVLTLKDFLRISERLVEKQTHLQAICKKAASEIIVRQTLAELDQWDVQAKFQLTDHVDSKDKQVFLIKDFKEHSSKIGDHQSLLQSVKNSADYDSFSERADVWESRLTDLDHYLTLLAQIQRKWIYLEPIFGSGTLANEKSRFDRLNREFRNVLNFIEKDARVSAILRYPNLRTSLVNISEQLSRCQKGLDDFLAEKRDKFPRFLFLGDDDLLEVVGQSSKEQVIQSHLKKLFAGIHSTTLDANGKKITEIQSLQGEIVPLQQAIDISLPVETWLTNLVTEMQGTLKELLIKCLADGKSPDPLKYPSQILCLAASINFTNKCEQAINSVTLQQLLTTYQTQLKYYSDVDVGEDASLSSLTSDNEANLLEIKLKALLLDTIQYISIIQELLESNVTKISDWQWQKQLRFYANTSGLVAVKMVNAEMEYSFEYIGNAQKLVRTPLTEKCFLTLTQGMHLGMGGNPYGPAGTGKTESVKALAALLGRQVLVFNCDEGIDAASMGRILSGLVRSGAWGCFDEFNRLDEATLSAVSMYIQPIQNALRLHSTTVTLMDKEIEVNKHCGIFVTLNPAGGGYGGRNKLPDNLKQLFRPVVMTHPDHEQIARTLLYCDGYQKAAIIGRKLVELFSVAAKLLSKQQHYDWGLRALRTVLTGCGRSMKEHKKHNRQETANDSEFALVVNSVRLDTLSKLTYNDSKIFEGLVRDIFPTIEASLTTSDPNMLQALQESFADLSLQPNERQIAKCVELYEQLRQRMGVAIVGPARSGKTTIRNLLRNALKKQGKSIKQYVFNPKSMPRTQLLGQIDHDTRQWTDGVLTQYSLQVIQQPLEVSSFIVCDGDIDPEWVESLNSVMDDNRLLSLPSGWRVQFGPNVNFIFETHDLSYASPATISRMGIVFLSDADIQVHGYVENYLDKLPEEKESLISTYIEDYLYNAVDWVVNQGELVLPTPKLSLMKTALTLVQDANNKEEFIVNLVNALGGQLEYDFRQVFAQQMFENAGVNIPSYPARAMYDADRNLIDSYLTQTQQAELSDDNKMPLIMTGQVQHTLDVLKRWFVQNGEHILLVGPHGSAKTLTIEHIHGTSDSQLGNLATIHCSAHVTPQYVIHKIMQYCMVVNSSRGKIYRPRRGHLTLYLKNVHLLRADKWGTNMLTAFLQQLIVYNGFFDNNLEWVLVENITVVGTLTNRNDLSTGRFTSLFNVFNVDLPDNEDINTIFSSYLGGVLKKANVCTWSKQKITKLTLTMLKVYNEVKAKFNEVHPKRHYIFSPHDITTWCKGILRYKLMSNDIETTILEIVCNEALRIFHDRLVSVEERAQFKEILNEAIMQEWAKPILANVTDNYFVAASQFNKAQAPLTKLNADDWSTIVRKGITQYEREGYLLDVEIIPELLHLAATLSRALTCPGGHALLAGNSGVGRRSAAKIISVMESAKLIVPVSGNDSQFKIDLKQAIHSAGIDGDQVYLLLEDHVLNNNSVLNTMNIFLSSGEVPGLFTNAELDSLTAGLRDEVGRSDFDGNLYEFFVERTKNQLHVLTCVEIENANFWQILDNCPAILQKSTQIWMSEWCKETMKKIPKLIIKKYNEKSKADMQIKAAKHFVGIEHLVNLKLSSPMRYINMINSYIQIYHEKQATLVDQQKKLKGGIGKLTEARNVVAELKLNAGEQQERLAEKQKKANKALDMISNTMKNANVQKEQMEVLKQHTEKENIQLQKRKREIEVELAEVEPLIQEARNAIGNIKSESLSEIRSLRAPPEVIRDILEGVLRLMGIQDTSWNSMKTFLAKRGVKEDIRAFQAGRITSASREAVEKLIASKHDSFDQKNAKRASVAAAPLASWVMANVRYSKVVQKIKPLETEQNKLEENLSEAESQLSNLSAGLMDVDATVEKLKQELATYTREGAEIEIKLSAAQETLHSAEGLVRKLNDEYERWQNQLKGLEIDLQKLPTNSLLAAAFLNYLSCESEDVRIRILTQWLDIVKDDFQDVFTLEHFLSSEREQLQWQSEGLATDQLSIQNAIIVNKAKVCPFLIDPTSMGIDWIKTRMKSKSFEATTQNSHKFNMSLELAIRFGKVLLIEEVETISSILLTLLRKQFVYQGERMLISLNGKLIDYNKDFQLVLSTRNANLQLPGDLQAIINIVNFTTTRAGLTEQLLISAIKQESPQLADKRKTLLRQREELQEKQHQLQTQLLEDLANSQGNILENKNLLASLNETKASSMAITLALEESSHVQEKLVQEYDVYRQLSQFASALYFGAQDFLRTNVIYALSVASFTALFLQSLPTMEGLQNTENYRHKILIQALYQYMGRGIFKSDRLKFLLHLIHKMFPEQLPDDEWQVLIGNVLIANRPETSKSRESVPAWIPNSSTPQVSLLQLALPSLYASLDLDNEMLWKEFMQNPKCEISFPKHCKVSEFQKVVVVQALRTDRLYSAMSQCALHMTGMNNLNLDAINLSQIYRESTSNQPILLITTSGNDPSIAIREVALKEVNDDKYVEMSMGEGQEAKAIATLEASAQSGKWLILKNLHLVTGWLPVLCQSLQEITPAASFRLWLVSEAHANFSSVLAENSLKLAYEAPVGIRSNLHKIFTSYGCNYIQALNPTASRIFFVLGLLHAVLQERRNYIPQGWSKWYEFGDVDLSTMVQLSEDLWAANTSMMHNVPWKYLIGWALNAVYGGRIEKGQDFSILEACLKQNFTDEVLSYRWKPLGILNSLPSTSNYQNYLNFISHIAIKDIPTYFGLPENVDRAWERNTSADVIQYLKNLSITTDNQDNNEQVNKNLQLYVSLWKKINHGQEFTRAQAPQPSQTDNYNLETFITHELAFALNIIQSVHKCFSHLNKMAKGYLLGEEQYAQIGHELVSFKTPLAWLKLWNGPKEPARYLKELVNKTATISKWNQNSSTYYHHPINISQLFNADTFLSAFKKQFASSKHLEIDELGLKSYWKPKDGSIIITGLQIEGALFDGINLLPANVNSDSINPTPDVYITWEKKQEEDDRVLQAPLYYSLDREKLLTNLQVPCNNKEAMQWIQAGVAFFLN